MMGGSYMEKKNGGTNFNRLIGYVVQAVHETGIPDTEWTIGGGTVLSTIFNHRLSNDIDVFIHDIQYLSRLSPRLTDYEGNLIYYNEMANYISLVFPEGKIDFIVSSQLTQFQAKEQNFFGHQVELEDAVEIVVKKLYHRGAYAVPRDIFDLATVYHSDRKEDLIDAIALIPNEFRIFSDELQKKEPNNSKLYSLMADALLLPGSREIVGKEIQICQDLIHDVQQKIESNS